jgi:hypothetical protein
MPAFVTLLMPLLFAAPLALAQTASGDRIEERLPAVPPPPPEMQPFDDALNLEPQVTIHPTARGTEEEYRINGKLYMIKVTPEVGAPYYLIDNDGDGRLETHSPASPDVQVPMWVIGTF